ncbi:MAG: NUDIX hydrolase [Planctomycetota bacterium]|nr:MAG: NUDIX hydrolase [Planctomycetota bacterium]
MPTGRVILQARKFRVEQFDRPGAARVPPRYVVRHPGATVVLPILDSGEIVMIRNHRVSIDAELLELPAGTLEASEPPIDCARRELAEETGYSAARLTPLFRFYSSPGFCDERLHAFVALDLTPGRQHLDAGEEITVVRLAYSDAMHAIESGEIADGKTIATLLYYDRYVTASGTSQ